MQAVAEAAGAPLKKLVVDNFPSIFACVFPLQKVDSQSHAAATTPILLTYVDDKALNQLIPAEVSGCVFVVGPALSFSHARAW